MKSRELTVKRAEDSTSMVVTALYNPVALSEYPKAFRRFLPCQTSRVTIMSVRRTLRASESELYGIPVLAARESLMLPGCEVW